MIPRIDEDVPKVGWQRKLIKTTSDARQQGVYECYVVVSPFNLSAFFLDVTTVYQPAERKTKQKWSLGVKAHFTNLYCNQFREMVRPVINLFSSAEANQQIAWCVLPMK